MILECSECRTRYVVPDAAIGADGRTVRCATCRYSWFQPGIAQAEPEAAPVLSPPAATPPVEMPSTATNIAVADATAPVAAPPERPVAAALDGGAATDALPFRPRRNPARRWTIAAVSAGVAMLGAAGAILYSGAPGAASQLFRPAEGTPLRIVSKPIDQHVFNGNDIFAVSGTVLNPTDTRQSVPDIRADLRDAHQRVVFSWMIRPDALVLPPRGRVQFDSAQIDVPVNAKELVLSFSGDPAH